MDLKKSNTSATNLQDLISEGRKILMKKPEGSYFVQIRFNFNDVDGTRKWRVIMDGLEFQVSEILLSVPCKTESEFSEDMGGYKHHIVSNAKQVVFEKLIAYIN
jgi:hypothetical protein